MQTHFMFDDIIFDFLEVSYLLVRQKYGGIGIYWHNDGVTL